MAVYRAVMAWRFGKVSIDFWLERQERMY